MLPLSLVHASDATAALRALGASWSTLTAEPEVALLLSTLPPRRSGTAARVPRLAPLPLARRGPVRLRLPGRGAITNLKLEAQPLYAAPGLSSRPQREALEARRQNV